MKNARSIAFKTGALCLVIVSCASCPGEESAGPVGDLRGAQPTSPPADEPCGGPTNSIFGVYFKETPQFEAEYSSGYFRRQISVIDQYVLEAQPGGKKWTSELVVETEKSTGHTTLLMEKPWLAKELKGEEFQFEKSIHRIPCQDLTGHDAIQDAQIYRDRSGRLVFLVAPYAPLSADGFVHFPVGLVPEFQRAQWGETNCPSTNHLAALRRAYVVDLYLADGSIIRAGVGQRVPFKMAEKDYIFAVARVFPAKSACGDASFAVYEADFLYRAETANGAE